MDDMENVSLPSSTNQLNNNPFSELSSESFHKLDEVLNSDSVKQLLSDSKNLDQLTASVLETQASTSLMSSNVNSNLLINSSATIAPGHVATVQEGLDLVDALDSLVNQLTASQPSSHQHQTQQQQHHPQQQQQQSQQQQQHHLQQQQSQHQLQVQPQIQQQHYIQSQSHLIHPQYHISHHTEIEMLGGNLEVGSSVDSFVDSIFLDHNYACVPVKQKFAVKVKTLNQNQESETNNQSINTINTSASSNFNNSNINNDKNRNSPLNTTSSQSSPSPARRSQRQIERIEKSVLEKIKAENQEMLKREREEMEAQKIEKDLEKRKSLDTGFDSSTQGKEEDCLDEDKSRGLIIDFDMNKKKIGKKRGRKKLRTNSEGSSSLKPKVDDTRKELKENLDKSIEEDKVDAKNSSSQRSQRQRRKPKRWEDDEVEVDFSQKSLELDSENNSPSNSKPRSVKKDEKEEGAKKPKTSDDEDNDEDESEEYASDDDPDKLWCICRQPHNNRFMISCDGCEDWFHGKCVGVTRAMGRVYEKQGKKWYCIKCKDSKEPPIVVNKIENKTLESKSLENVTPIKKLTKPKNEEKKESVKKLKSENKTKLGSVLKAKVKGKSIRGQMSAEKKEAYRLKKLIKSTKLELKKTLNENKKDSLKDTTSSTAEAEKNVNRWEPISRVVPLIRKSEEKKKKLKHLPIDPSFNDLFKAEPIVMSKKAPSTPLTSPSTPSLSSSSPNLPSALKRSSSISSESSHTSKKMATSGASQEASCVACGKVLTKVTIRGKETSIYCAESCIEKHFKDMIESIKSTRSSGSSASLVGKGEKVLKINLLDKATGRLMSGSNAITEDKVLDYLKSNPTFEILKSNVVKKLSSTSSQQSDHEKKKDGAKSSSQHSKLVANKKKEVTKQKSSESVIKPSSKSEEHTSETIRLSVKKALKEALWTRCQETDNKMLTDDIKKIAFKIEEELFNYFNKEISSKYKNRYRSLVFNLRDSKNQGLFRKVVSGSISPERLVKMSPEELASSELAKWRERETKHAIEMIKRDAEQMSQQVIVKKTHKGEELIETLTSSESINTTKGEELANKSASSDTQVLITSSSGLSSPSKEKVNTCAALSTSDSDAIREGKAGTVVDERRKEEDSTDKHGQHLYDLHCKICTKQTKQDLSLTHFKTRTFGSSPTCSSTSTSSHETKVSQPKRVRVEFDEPTNKIIEEAAKLSRSSKEAKLNESNLGESSKDASLLSSSSSLIPSPDDASDSSGKAKSTACWKGFIYMQDVAKFVASAYKVSGIIETQIKDVPDTITVCGRIAPEQVLDYLKKLKYSTRTEISIIRFAPTNHEEKIGYDAFFSYLNHRKRYGVVGGTGKTIKDFYILPLPKENDPPDVLLPFDGPGLDKLSNRNNLLLGILVKNKKYQLKSTVKEKQPSVDANKSSTENTSSSREQPERSYTPPPPLSSKNDSVSEDPYDPGSNIQPLGEESQVSSIGKNLDESEEPYDPEENDLNTPEPCSQSSIKVSDLLDQLSKTNNPVEMTSTFLGSVAKNATIEEQKRLLEELTKRVEDSKRQLEEQRKAAEAAFTIASKSIDIINKTESSIPGLDGSYPSNDPNRSTLLDSLQIPENLKEILETVKQRGTYETGHKDDKMKGLSFDDPIVRDFGQENLDEDEDMEKDESGLTGIQSLEDEDKKIPEPMEIEEDDEGLNKRGTIIEVNNTKARIDPRLRSKKQQPLFSSNLTGSGSDKSVSQLKDEELIMKAHLQFEALKRMEMQQLRLEEAQKQAYKALGSMSDLSEAATASATTSSSPSSSTPSSIILSQPAPTIFSSLSPSQQQQQQQQQPPPPPPPPPPKLKIEWKKTCKPITKS